MVELSINRENPVNETFRAIRLHLKINCKNRWLPVQVIKYLHQENLYVIL